MKKAIAIVIAIELAGCATVPDSPHTTITKVSAWWESMCRVGREVLASGASLTGPAPDASVVVATDAGVSE